MNEITTTIDQLDVELYLMRLAAIRQDFDMIEHHASLAITLAGSIRRECFMATHTSGEVKTC